MSRDQRLVLAIAVLASFVSFLDGTVVNVALPAIMRELGGGLATQQWVVERRTWSPSARSSWWQGSLMT